MLTFIQYGILFVLVASPLAFGSVEPWAYSLINLFALLFLALWSIERLILRHSNEAGSTERRRGNNRLLIYPVSGFIALVLLQLIPLPLSWVKVLSLARVAFVEKLNLQSFGIVPPSHLTLSADPYLTALALVNFVCILIYFFLVVDLLKPRSGVDVRPVEDDDERRRRKTLESPFLRKLAFTIILIGFVVALFGIVQKLSGTDKLYWLRPLTHGGGLMGPFVNRDHFAGYLELPLGLALGLLLFLKREAPYRGLLMVAAIVMGAAIFYSGSRGGMLSFLFELVCAGILSLALKAGKGGHFFSARMLIPLLLVAVALAVIYIGPDAVLGRFQDKITDDQRLVVWQDTLGIAKTFPVLGAGFGTFRDVFPHFQNQDYASRYLQTHNDYLQLLAETGLLGAGCLLFSILVIVLRALRPSRSGFDFSRAVQQGAMLGVLGLLLHSFFDFNLQIPSNALLFAVCCGVLVGSTRD